VTTDLPGGITDFFTGGSGKVQTVRPDARPLPSPRSPEAPAGGELKKESAALTEALRLLREPGASARRADEPKKPREREPDRDR
jgi:hypothetical protein